MSDIDSFLKYGLLWAVLWIVGLFIVLVSIRRLSRILGWSCFLMLQLSNMRHLIGPGNYGRLLRATRKYYPPEVKEYIEEVLKEADQAESIQGDMNVP